MKADTLEIMSRKKKAEPTDPIRLPRSIAQKLRRLALHSRMDPSDYVEKEFGAIIDKKHAKMLEEQMNETKAK